MKKIISTFITVILFITISCDSSTEENGELPPSIDYKQEMRDFVIGISEYSKSTNTDFFIIPQNGIELISCNGEASGELAALYSNAIDGNGQEDLFYGYDNDDEATSSSDNSYLKSFLNISKVAGNTILVTDYCSTSSKIDDSYTQNNNEDYISFAANERRLNNIPNYPNTIMNENDDDIEKLSDIKNFLYLIDPSNFSTKLDFINAVTATNYDVIIMDLFFHDDIEFTSAEINQLRSKENGGNRLVISYLSIGEAEDYRYYWDSNWNITKPSWLGDENPDWEGNFKVKYWIDEWQNVIYGNDESYIKKILDAGFDGAYLDIIDAFDYYEQ